MTHAANALPFLAWVALLGGVSLGIPLLAAWWSLRHEHDETPAPVAPVCPTGNVRLIPKDAP